MPKAEMPDLEYRRTHVLKRKEVVRTVVRSATLRAVDDAGVTLALATKKWTPGKRVSEFSFTEGKAGAAAKSDEPTAICRLDVIGQTALRVRFSSGDEVKEVETRLFAAPPKAYSFELEEVEGGLTLKTAAGSYVVTFSPFSITAFDEAGEEVALIGGREKNFYAAWDAYATGLAFDAEGKPIATECFALRADEGIFGFGEQFGPLNKVGQTLDLLTLEAAGTIQPRSYKPIPFWFSTKGYGVFLNHTAPITAFVGSHSAADIQIAVEDDHLDYVLMLGTPQEVIGQYTGLTGRPQMPPEWSFGLWQSKISYKSADEALEVVRQMKAADLPLDVLHLDTHWFREDWRCDLEFAPDRFSDPKAFFAAMQEEGVHVSLWQLPYIPEGSSLFDGLIAVDGFIRRPDGSLYDVGICYTPGFEGQVGAIDFTNPQAVEVYQSYLRRLFEMGASAIKVDFGEQAPLDGLYHDGTLGERAHNLYPLLYNKAVAEVTEDATGEHIIWARSTWAGSQRYPLHWGGDSSANWANMVPQFRAGLSLAISGFSFWSQDVGGFLGEERGELFLRWLQAGCLLSHTRIHGTGVREIYNMGDDAFVEVARKALKLRYQLMPYLLKEAAHAATEGLPMIRPLVLDWPEDPTTHHIEDQWLLGRDLLVAPIMQAGGKRRVYLPEGDWVDWWSGEALQGSRWINCDMPLDQFPLYKRAGVKLPLAE